MNDSVRQFFNILNSLPLSKKISMVFVIILVVTGFALMFFWTNQENYQVLFSNLSQRDASAIAAKLKERNTPYKVEANGTMIMVPEEKVYDLRLSLAGDGLPNGGNVGFEIFDHTDFKTTRFVQELNYRRALQGELARTINRFKEVNDSRVFIAIPEESLFIEDRDPASASIQLDLHSNLPPAKLTAIVHLVASAIEGLEPEHVTVVDTKGRLIFKGGISDESSSELSNSQLDYKTNVEDEIKTNVQSMLEGIVGSGKAIVRVNAEIEFDKITLSEEEYDPSATAVRSSRNIEEVMQAGEKGSKTAQTLIDKRRGVVPSPDQTQNKKTKKDIATNYEINKITRTTLKPAGKIKRLSVAAVIDGNYELEKLEDGTTQKKYTPRSEQEIKVFEEIVKKAMGYNEDREDQISVSSIPFAGSAPIEPSAEEEVSTFDLVLSIVKDYRKTIVNFLLVVMVFMLIVKPLLKSVKNITKEVTVQSRQLASVSEEYESLSLSKEMNRIERVREISKNDPEKAQQLVKGWIGE
ncbi:MAG: flagellar M-ring protein FliF [Deltaproteobacteria bacterium]|nr:flagellar M-ring protein FliF [Deltaproteobacteria bacterium]